MRIAFLCPFSYPSKCGVWNVVYNTAKELKKRGHEIHVFSSNAIKGTSSHSRSHEIIGGIHYHRFKPVIKISENATVWRFKKELMSIKPDVIHSHNFRHPHSTIAPFIAKKLGIPCFLTTHAPFLERKIRNPLVEIYAFLYDKILAKKVLNKYNKVFAISYWEIPYLTRLGCKKENIIYLPNGMPSKLLRLKIRQNKQAVYMGRISPVKNLGILVEAAKEIPEMSFKIYGPIERGFAISPKSENLKIINKSYDLKEQLNELKKSSIFILPSKREGIPLSLLEAMAAGLIPVSSRTQGGTELVKDKYNGFIFKDKKELKEILLRIIKDKKLFSRISKRARESVKDMTWEKITDKLERIYKESLKK